MRLLVFIEGLLMATHPTNNVAVTILKIGIRFEFFFTADVGAIRLL